MQDKDETIEKAVADFCQDKLGPAFEISEKLARYQALKAIKEQVTAEFLKEDDEDLDTKTGIVSRAYDEAKYNFMRRMVLVDKKRLDSRSMTQIRPIEVEVGILPRSHGSGLFTRGETQVLAVVTLGTKEDEQIIDELRDAPGVKRTKKFMLHYNFPPFSVGETGPLRPPGRREIGHGNLAERAVMAMLPKQKDFPYTIRVVCETLESNGSSSMGSVCSASMALMDAGVPMQKPVAGIAMGLIKEGDSVEVLSDILGDEDHLGDMDFKVAGTRDGVTAIQMDIKIEGVSKEILERALAQAKEGRLHILDKMSAAITEQRSDLSDYAPRVYTIQVNPEKIADIIGTGGKVIRGIIEETGVKIDIEDDGTVNICSVDGESARKAQSIIEGIVEEVEIGKVYNGTVKKVVDFGAFVAVTPSTEGLLHISEIAHERVQQVEDYLKEGDQVEVKVLDIDRSGKVRLSRKALLENPNPDAQSDDRGGRSGGGYRGGGGNRGGGGRRPYRH